MTGGHGPGFSGIAPDEMAQMIRVLEASKEQLENLGHRYRSRFAVVNAECGTSLDTSVFYRLGAEVDWLDDQLSMLRRRHDLTVAMDGSPAPGGLVPVPAGLDMTAEEARSRGRELARKLAEAFEVGDEDRITELLNRLAEHTRDPAYASGFFLGLGRRGLLGDIVAMLSGTQSPAADLRTVSTALGVAVSARYPPEGFRVVREYFTSDPQGQGEVWARGALLRYGDFPADWLAKVAKANVFDDFAADPRRPWHGASEATADELGLSTGDTVGLYLNVLAGNPEAARQVFATMGEPDNSRGTSGNILLLMHYAAGHPTPSVVNGEGYPDSPVGPLQAQVRAVLGGPGPGSPEVVEAFGAALAAAAGVTTEEMGDHSEQAARFAFTTIMTMGNWSSSVPPGLGDTMARIAGSYAPAITYGATPGSGRDSYPVREGPTGVPGLDPAFSLSFRDTYQFLQTFGDSAEMAAPFNAAMHKLTDELLADAAAEDRAQMRRTGDRDLDNIRRVFEQLGYVAGLQSKAQEYVRMQEYEDAQKLNNLVDTASGLGTLGAAVAWNPPGAMAAAAWNIFLYAANQGISSATGPGESPESKLEQARARAAQAAPLRIATHLRRAGFDFPVEPPPSILTDDGELVPYSELTQNPQKREAFEDWLQANGAYGTDNKALGHQVVSLANESVGSASRARWTVDQSSED